MSSHPRLVKAAVASCVVALALLAAVARPAAASAAPPCWKVLLNDWYDGRIDHTYPIHCYQDALHHLPADVQTYSSAHDDILRALLSAKARLKRAGTHVTANTPVPPSGTGGTGKNGTGTATSATTTTTTSEPGRNPGNGLGGAAADTSSSPSSVPVPLIVLGGLALLLIAAGAVGLIVKRRQGG